MRFCQYLINPTKQGKMGLICVFGHQKMPQTMRRFLDKIKDFP
jgi:hypothetical protein